MKMFLIRFFSFSEASNSLCSLDVLEAQLSSHLPQTFLQIFLLDVLAFLDFSRRFCLRLSNYLFL